MGRAVGAWSAALALVLELGARAPCRAAGAKLVETTLASGTCQKLVVAGRDLTKACAAQVGHNEFADRSTTYQFTTDREITVTFTLKQADEVGLGGELRASNVGGVVYSVAGRSNVIRSAGTCTYGNPDIGAAKIACRVETGLGVFEATFLTDGQPPEHQRY